MSFKIVQTEEPGRDAPSLTIVPCAWEVNGVLFWPKNKKNVSRIIKDPYSKPEDDWIKYPCAKKRESFLLYKSAEEELKAMLQNYDSESDYNNTASLVTRQTTKKLSIPEAELEAYNNFNCLAAKSYQAMQSLNNNTKNQVKILDVQVIPVNKPAQPLIRLANNQTQPSDFESVCGSTNNINQAESQGSYEILAETDGTYDTKETQQFAVEFDLKQILENEKTILKNQELIIKELGTQRTMLDFLIRREEKELGRPSGKNQDEHAKQLIEDIFPINCIEELDKLELELMNEENVKKLVDRKSKICGTSGKMNGKSCCYTLVDYFFKREFLLNFSWSGGSRDKEKKNCFKTYTNIIKTFHLIIEKADIQFSLKQCEDFFKCVIKNAKRRADNSTKEESKKRMSASKKRPENLTYNKHQANKNNQEDEEQAEFGAQVEENEDGELQEDNEEEI